MKSKLFTLTAAALVAAGTACQSEVRYARDNVGNANQSNQPKKETARAGSHDGHDHGPPPEPGRVPAFETNPKNLPATLDPAAFVGKTRQAYMAVREIPETIAQLPCYCHCDRGFGHKSLHSCFVDGHASSCAVCVEEALLAYRLEKQENLTPEQIRQRIIEVYSKL